MLALDQGTSSSRAVIFDGSGQALASAQVPLPIHYPADGWVEQDPLAIWSSQLQAMQQLEAQLSPEQRAAVAAAASPISAKPRCCGVRMMASPADQPWFGKTGAPRRSAASGASNRSRELAAAHGLVLDPYFSASKVQWLLENNAEAAAAKAAGTCALAPWTVGCCGS